MKLLNKEEQKIELKRIKTSREKIMELEEVCDIATKAYNNLYREVDNMFYHICNQWEDGMDIEEIVGDLRKIMYGDNSNKGVK